MLTTAQAKAAGLSAPVLVKLVKAGRSCTRGVACTPSTRSRVRHGGVAPAAVRGAFLLYPDAVLAGTSALLVTASRLEGARRARPSSRPSSAPAA